MLSEEDSIEQKLLRLSHHLIVFKMEENSDDLNTSQSEFALNHILNYDQKTEEFGTPLLKNKSSGLDADIGNPNIADSVIPSQVSDITHSRLMSITANSSHNSAVKRSPLSTFKLMSQTIAEYGEMIAQRRTEIAELQRANSLRISASGYPKV